MATSKRLRIGIVGGSIAGCTTAVELLRLGHHVELFERTGEALKDRGAGIGLPPSVLASFRERELVDAAFPFFLSSVFSRLWRTPEHARGGYLAWDQPAQLCCVNWSALYASLRRRVPDTAYHSGCAVKSLASSGQAVRLTLANGDAFDCDLAVCADGHASIGRQALFPDLRPSYAGYVLWRGSLPEAALDDPGPLESGARSTGYPGGHGIFYFVPGPGGSTERGQRLVNWGMYLPCSAGKCAELLVDRGGRARDNSLPPGSMPRATERSLKDSVRGLLPDFYEQVVLRSEDTSVYSIEDLEIPAYARDRIALVGDAGALARPHSGAGALKGMNDAISLGEALARGDDLTRALDTWSQERAKSGNHLVRFGAQLGQALVTDIPDWSRMDATSMEQWFASIVTIREGMFAQPSPGR